MKHIKTFLIFESEGLSKKQLRNKLWHERNPNPTGKIVTPEEVLKLGVPEKIVDMMKSWDLIYKSPYSKSFYSSTDIGWSHKPDNSYRVSDHWNFKTNRNDTIHCKTDKVVPLNNTHFAIGKYSKDKDLYEIILIEPSNKFVNKKVSKLKKLQYFKDFDTLKVRKEFKDKVRSGLIDVEITFKDGKIISGNVLKYTGQEIRVANNGEVIYTENYIKSNNTIKSIDLFENGKKIKDPFILEFD